MAWILSSGRKSSLLGTDTDCVQNECCLKLAQGTYQLSERERERWVFPRQHHKVARKGVHKTLCETVNLQHMGKLCTITCDLRKSDTRGKTAQHNRVYVYISPMAISNLSLRTVTQKITCKRNGRGQKTYFLRQMKICVEYDYTQSIPKNELYTETNGLFVLST